MKVAVAHPKDDNPAKPAYAAAQADQRPAATAQRQAQAAIDASPRQVAQRQQALAPRPNATGLPDRLKTGVENLSGHSLDDVRVHYNSARPAQLQALAYAQGTDIHVGPGQEKHLPHEVWHVVQQKQGRVKPTIQLKGKIGINDDAHLEREADKMGAEALGIGQTFLANETKENMQMPKAAAKTRQAGILQRVINTTFPVRFYRRSGGSKSSIVNEKILAYNKAQLLGTATNDELRNMLEDIKRQLPHVSKKKKAVATRIASEIKTEEVNIDAVEEVMKVSAKRAELQSKSIHSDLVSGNLTPSRAETFIKSREVLHATNPLKIIDKKRGKTVGDSLAESGEIQSIHQTNFSAVGSDKDGAKRLNAEIGLFYPEKYRRNSFSRDSHTSGSATKGIDKSIRPANSVLPKYAAINLASSRFGALQPDPNFSLHFALKEKVLKERTTFTSGDSLQEWVPTNYRFNSLKKSGVVKDKEHLPKDDEAWGMGPIATYGTNNFGQLLRDNGQNIENYESGGGKNPADYVEAQIHGELRIDRDVSHVRANFVRLFGNPQFESLYKSLRANKIKIIWYYHDYYANQAEKPGQITQDWGTTAHDKTVATSWKLASGLWKDTLKKRPKEKHKDIKETAFLEDESKQKLAEMWTKLAMPIQLPVTGKDITPKAEQSKSGKVDLNTTSSSGADSEFFSAEKKTEVGGRRRPGKEELPKHRQPSATDEWFVLPSSEAEASGNGQQEYNISAIMEDAQRMLAAGKSADEIHQELHDNPEYGLPHDVIKKVLSRLSLI